MPPHSQNLLPNDPQEGWSDLVGFRRYQFEPSRKNTLNRVHEFVAGAGLELVRGNLDHATVRALRFNSFMVSHVQVAGAHLLWSRNRNNALNRYLYLFVNRGTVEIEGDEAHWSSKGGGLCIIFPGDSPVHIRITEISELIFFSFDQKEVAPHMLTPENVGEVSPSSTVFRASFAYLQAVVHLPVGEVELTEDPVILHAITRDVARAVTMSAIAARHPDPDLATMQATISQRSADPDFTPDTLSSLFGVSRSTVGRLYSRHGLHVSREIRRSRTHRAMELIGKRSSQSLDDVAIASGFGSRSSMNRAFKELYGAPPVLSSASPRPA